MKNFRLSLVNNDHAVTCRAELQLKEDDRAALNEFLQDVFEELVIGQSAFLEIEGSQIKPITVSVSDCQ